MYTSTIETNKHKKEKHIVVWRHEAAKSKKPESDTGVRWDGSERSGMQVIMRLATALAGTDAN
jgi:hypothetical protein